MRRLLVLLLASAALAGCANGQATSSATPLSAEARLAQSASETERLNAWFDEVYLESLEFSPIEKTFLGIKDEDYDKIDDFSEKAQKKQLDWQLSKIAEMQRRFDYDLLSDDAKISYDLFIYQGETAARAFEFVRNQFIFEQMGGAQSQLPTFLISIHGVESEADMEAYINRVREGGRAIDQARERAEKAAEGGVHPPAFAYDGAIEQARAIVTGAPFTKGADSDIWADMQREIAGLLSAGKITPLRAEELKLASETALKVHFGPAYDRLIAYLEADKVNAQNPTGAKYLPDGLAYYDERLSYSTTTDLTAEEVHAIGLAEVARLRGEMETIKNSLGFEGSLDEFFEFVRTDPNNYYPNTDAGRQAYIDDATAKIDYIEAKLPDYFGLLPKADLVVKRVEPFREQDGAAQHYYPSTPDGSRPGIYYAHLSDMNAMPKNQLEVIAYHEALPGHHMQIAIAQELEGVPRFRTQSRFTVYSEGWALYSELLAKEMGAYEDPYADFGRLTTEMWRAIRLVVDTGLHAKGWSEEEALAYFMANSPEPEASARAEIRRYITWPGQATSYKIGMIKILELRDKAKTELGDAFDIRAFHDVVLGRGAVPLELLERQVDGWIASVKAAG